MRPRDRHRGSVLLMVIGLLTVIAMLGSMLLLVARIDRQTSQAIAAAAPADQVAQGVLDRILADRLADLYIDAAAGEVYGALRAKATYNDAERGMIDYPHEDYDQALACIETYDPGTGPVWRHVSHLPGTTLVRELQPNPLLRAIDVPTNDPNLVDADGDTATRDALLFGTGVFDSNGDEFYAAVRMIDASGLLNVNIAGTPADAGGSPPIARVADITRVMDPSYLALEVPLPTRAANVVGERDPVTGDGPFDMGDMLAVGWLDPTPLPNTANGRLREAADLDFLAARASLTGESTSTPLSPLWTYVAPALTPAPMYPRVTRVWVNDPAADLIADTNNARINCYRAFLAMLQAYNPDMAVNTRRAAQLTANLIDYLDSKPDIDEDFPTRLDAYDLDATNFPTAGQDFFYGLERHPYVSKVFRKRTYNAGPPESFSETAAIELINPYADQLDLTNYLVGGNQLLPGKYIAPGGRFVVYTDNSIQFDPAFTDLNCRIQLGINTANPVYITWKHPTQNWEIHIDETEGIALPVPDATNPNYWNVRCRDDRLDQGRYTLPNYAQSTVPGDQDIAVNYTDPAGPKMGQINPLTPPPTGDAAPVYIRNGPMICLGDMMRLFIVGPTETVSFTKGLDAAPVRQLVPWETALPVVDHVPLGCLTSEFFNLLTPQDDAAGDPLLHRGLVNINTAPATVLKCLPGLAALDPPGPRPNATAVADEIIAYRDNGIVGGRNYSNRAAPPPVATGITSLRNQPGFATASEVAIPLRVAVGAAINNTYNPGPPDNYALSAGPPRNDDGIPTPGVQDDPIKQNVLYTWLSNQVTVRSNVFIVYIRVQLGPDTAFPNPRRYVAVIDRGNCRTAGVRPKVLMFAELR